MMERPLLEEIVELVLTGRKDAPTSAGELEEVVKQAKSRFCSPKEVPFFIQVSIRHQTCIVDCPRSVALEVWRISGGEYSLSADDSPLLPFVFLKNAIRSQLHFSQLNAWLMKNASEKEDPRFALSYKVLNSDALSGPNNAVIEKHCFPLGQIAVNSSRCVRVTVRYIKSEKLILPTGKCPWNSGLFCDEIIVRKPPVMTAMKVHIKKFQGACGKSAAQNSIENEATKVNQSIGCGGKSPRGGGKKKKKEKFEFCDGLMLTPPVKTKFLEEILTESTKMSETPNKTEKIEFKAVKTDKEPFEETPTIAKPLPISFNRSAHSMSIQRESSPAVRCSRHKSSVSESEIDKARRAAVAKRSAPLLGSFEESALHGRLSAITETAGYTLQIAATGCSLISPHVMLPLKTCSLESYCREAPPLPRLAICPLSSLGRKGYRIPKKGILQATLFNPEKAVVRIFVVQYDLSDLAADQTTFIRQRSYLMPKEKKKEKEAEKSMLRYVVHLRVRSDRVGRLYLHTDVRILFTQNTTADIVNIEIPRGSGARQSDAYQLRSFIEIPSLNAINATVEENRRIS